MTGYERDAIAGIIGSYAGPGMAPLAQARYDGLIASIGIFLGRISIEQMSSAPLTFTDWPFDLESWVEIAEGKQ